MNYICLIKFPARKSFRFVEWILARIWVLIFNVQLQILLAQFSKKDSIFKIQSYSIDIENSKKKKLNKSKEQKINCFNVKNKLIYI